MQADTTNLVISAQSHVDDLGKFLKERSLKKTELNAELYSVFEKLRLELKTNNAKKLLYSVPLTEVVVQFHEQTLNNLYCNVNKSYPKTGLFLREINVFHMEYLSDHYYNNIVFSFNFDVSEFNREMSLECLGFNDEDCRLSEQVMGVGFNPRFINKDKYIFVRDVLRDVKDKVFTAQKDLNK